MVTPEDVTFEACFDDAAQKCLPATKVIDPEKTLEALNEQQSIDEAAAANDAVFHTTLTLLSVAGDVAAVSSGRVDSANGLGTMAIAASGHDRAEAHAQGRARQLSTRDLWSNVALRRNTLAPGRGVAGLVFIPVNLRARSIVMRVRAGKETFRFEFQQYVKTPAPPAA
ncbi:MAG TPA: hypothetical protein VGG33_24820 [Polyangia bacterium]